MPLAYPYDYMIGSVAAGLANMTNLAALATPVRFPKSSPMFYAQTITLADNTERGIGLPMTPWHWTSLPQDMRDMLRSFCPGASASVYIRTRGLDVGSGFKSYLAVMVWPSLAETYDARYRTDFTLEFRQMVLQNDPVPTIDTVTPDTGPAAGGTTVTLTGTRFGSVTGVTFGGGAGTALKIISDTELTVAAPAHAAGAVDVVATNSGGTGTKSNGYTYS
jgi:hypothetical protein